MQREASQSLLSLEGSAQSRKQLQTPPPPQQHEQAPVEKGRFCPCSLKLLAVASYQSHIHLHPNLAALAAMKTQVKKCMRNQSNPRSVRQFMHMPHCEGLSQRLQQQALVWGLYHEVVVRATQSHGSKGHEMNEPLCPGQVRSPHAPGWPLSWHVSGTNGPEVTVTILADIQRRESDLF